jgi:hypothetical protein
VDDQQQCIMKRSNVSGVQAPGQGVKQAGAVVMDDGLGVIPSG